MGLTRFLKLWKDHLDTYSSGCAYCGCDPHPDEATLDHIHPTSRGGADHALNFALACSDCNHLKDGRTPEEWLNDIERGRL